MSPALFPSLLSVVLPYYSGFSVTAAGVHIYSQVAEDQMPSLFDSVAEVIVGQNHSPQNNNASYRTEFL